MPYTSSNFPSNKPFAPTIGLAYDERNKVFTITTTAKFQPITTGYNATTTTEISLSSNFSTVEKTASFNTTNAGSSTTSDYGTITLTFPKPFNSIYIRARSVNTTDSINGEYTSVQEFIPRPLWGVVVDDDGTKHDIVDIREVDTSNTLSPKDWIEGTLEGKERIVGIEG